MNFPAFLTQLARVGHAPGQRRYYLMAAAILAVAAISTRLFTGPSPGPGDSSFHEVKRDNFLVTVVAGGSLTAVREVIVRCEVEGNSQIVHIIPEGTIVSKGDLLVELDASLIESRLIQQELACQAGIEACAQAEANLEIQRAIGEGNIANADLNEEFAASDLEKYQQGEWPQAKMMAESKITLAEEELNRAVDRRDWTVKLHEKGYATKSELEADHLAVKRQEIARDQAREELRLLVKYDHPKQSRKLELALQTAQREVERARAQFDAQISQGKAAVIAKKGTLAVQEAQLEKLREQLARTRIVAPQDGLVVYADTNSRSSTMIGEGAVVRERQELIKLPDTSRMLVKVQVHESQINHLRPGLPAWVTIDSMPDRRYRGHVSSISPLPDAQSRWTNPDLKVYSTEVVIEEALHDVKPGISAQAEIVVTNLRDVLTVPIQAVTTVNGRQVVHVRNGAGLDPVPVEVGLYNHKHIEIRSGLDEGARIALSPPAGSNAVPSLPAPADAESEQLEPDAQATAQPEERRTRSGHRPKVAAAATPM